MRENDFCRTKVQESSSKIVRRSTNSPFSAQVLATCLLLSLKISSMKTSQQHQNQVLNDCKTKIMNRNNLTFISKNESDEK